MKNTIKFMSGDSVCPLLSKPQKVTPVISVTLLSYTKILTFWVPTVHTKIFKSNLLSGTTNSIVIVCMCVCVCVWRSFSPNFSSGCRVISKNLISISSSFYDFWYPSYMLFLFWILQLSYTSAKELKILVHKVKKQRARIYRFMYRKH